MVKLEIEIDFRPKKQAININLLKREDWDVIEWEVAKAFETSIQNMIKTGLKQYGVKVKTKWIKKGEKQGE